MIYYKLYSLERKGWIKDFQERHGRVYCLTEQGNAIVDSMKKIVEENTAFLRTILISKKVVRKKISLK